MAIRIINYEGLAREFEWVRGARLKYDLVILDEAQRIKNPDSLSARSVKAIRARYRWALTGTPLENRIEDLRSICEFVHPGLVQSDALAVIRREIGPYMLRRRAEDVLKDLPRMVDQDIAIRLTRRQRVAYDRAERDGVLRLNDLGENVTITHVFQLITSLRQVCNFEPVSGESAKLDYLREELDEIVDGGRKALVFSQFTNRSGLSALAMELEEFRPAQLHGRVPPRKRDQLVETFGRTTEHAVMLCNYKVAGVGLNLQAANYVYLFDRWWNPAVEDQAIKRVHRIGQRDCVFVRRFVCRNTIEERILKKLQEKRALFDSVINEAEPARAMGLTEEEVFSLFDLHVRPRRRK